MSKTAFLSIMLAIQFAMTVEATSPPMTYQEISMLLRNGETPAFIQEDARRRKLLSPLTSTQIANLTALGATPALLEALRAAAQSGSVGALDARAPASPGNTSTPPPLLAHSAEHGNGTATCKLCDAIGKGDKATLESLITAGALHVKHLNFQHQEESLLVVAMRTRRNPEIFDLLVKYLDINECIPSTLIDADPYEVKLLLDHGADPNRRFHGRSLFSAVLDQRHDSKLEELLRARGASELAPSPPDILVGGKNWDRAAKCIFTKDRQGFNRFSLVDALDRAKIPDCDLTQIIIHRLPKDAGKMGEEIRVNLVDEDREIDPEKNVFLAFGDVVEVPKRVLTPAETGPGIHQNPYGGFGRCLSRTVTFKTGSKKKEFTLTACFLDDALQRKDIREFLPAATDFSRVRISRVDPVTNEKVQYIEKIQFGEVSSGFKPARPPGYDQVWLLDRDLIEVPDSQGALEDSTAGVFSGQTTPVNNDPAMTAALGASIPPKDYKERQPTPPPTTDPLKGGVREDANDKKIKAILSAATKDQPWGNSLGMRFVPVPGTKVLFCIWDTRVADFAKFVERTNYDATQGMYSLAMVERTISGLDGGGSYNSRVLSRGPAWAWVQVGATWQNPGFVQKPNHPVVGVNWDDANAFCAWLTEEERREGKIGKNQRYRLPKSAEWSKASDGGTYPWGETWPPSSGDGNYRGEENHARFSNGIKGFDDGVENTSRVGSFRANSHGLYDMGGNVWQWCENAASARAMSEPMPNPNFRILRGGSWNSGEAESPFSFSHDKQPASYRCSNYGFRCVLDLGD